MQIYTFFSYAKFFNTTWLQILQAPLAYPTGMSPHFHHKNPKVVSQPDERPTITYHGRSWLGVDKALISGYQLVGD